MVIILEGGGGDNWPVIRLADCLVWICKQDKYQMIYILLFPELCVLFVYEFWSYVLIDVLADLSVS